MYNGSTMLLCVTIFVVHKQSLIRAHCSIVTLPASSNMIESRIIYQVIFSASFGVALALALIVLAYLKSKPTGMQTLLDLIIKDLIIIATTYRTIVVFVIFSICNVAPVDYRIACGLTVLLKLFHVFCAVDIFIIIIVRYILIYYNADISDTKLLRISRIVMFVSLIIIWITEVMDFKSSGIVFMALSQIEGTAGTSNQILGSVLLVDVIVLILTQIKIEKNNNSYNNAVASSNQNESDKGTNYSLSAIRGVIIAVILICFIVLAIIFVPTNSTNQTDVFLYITLILEIIIGNICPAIFISRNPKMVEFVKTRYLYKFRWE
jgi:hypothetical protein